MKQPEYSMFYNPVWKALDDWGLPYELIDIIIKYKTFYSFSQVTSAQIDSIYNYGYNFSSFINLFSLVKHDVILNFNSLKNNYMETNLNMFFNSFLFKYQKLYFKDTDYIMECFYRFYNTYNDRYTNSLIHVYVFIKDSIPLSSRNIIKELLYSEYKKNIKGILKKSYHDTNELSYNKVFYNNYFDKDDILHYKYDTFRFNLKYIWKNMVFLLKHYSYGVFNEDITRTDILMYNFMGGFSYNHEWDNKTLYKNLIKNEFNGSYIINMFDKNPDKYNMESLYDTLIVTPFSSGDNDEDTFNRFAEYII